MSRPRRSNGCGKARYRDEIAAKLTLATIQGRDNPNREKQEKRAYKCPRCNGWHLTSISAEKWKRKEDAWRQ